LFFSGFRWSKGFGWVKEVAKLGVALGLLPGAVAWIEHGQLLGSAFVDETEEKLLLLGQGHGGSGEAGGTHLAESYGVFILICGGLRGMEICVLDWTHAWSRLRG
jgi:hypothetical protein